MLILSTKMCLRNLVQVNITDQGVGLLRSSHTSTTIPSDGMLIAKPIVYEYAPSELRCIGQLSVHDQ